MPTEQEPRPRIPPLSLKRRSFSGGELHVLPPPQALPDIGFADVLGARRSAVSGPLSDQKLSDLLFHVMRRRRGGSGRFGLDWEGRASPSAGGLHVISILCIPVEDHAPVGLYDPKTHTLRLLDVFEGLKRENAISVGLLASAKGGTTLQFIADAGMLANCYEYSDTLLWRDSGALAATICFAATSLGLTSVVLGRTGADLLASVGFNVGLLGAGAVHLGSSG